MRSFQAAVRAVKDREWQGWATAAGIKASRPREQPAKGLKIPVDGVQNTGRKSGVEVLTVLGWVLRVGTG